VTLQAPAPEAYRGRFAPSPSGPLHFGSLVAAIASYLAARTAGGAWLLRIDDIDTPRVIEGATASILASLRAHGLSWDEDVIYQSERNESYRHALAALKDAGLAYPCSCTRKAILATAKRGPNGALYPGTCRNRRPTGGKPYVWRARLPADSVSFDDIYQGSVTIDLARELGDFVLQRRDGVYSYQLGTGVDDGSFGITHVVRGADLLPTTAGQIWLREQLGLSQPRLGHIPVVVDQRGVKLSKQAGAQPINDQTPIDNLRLAMSFLGIGIESATTHMSCHELLEWAVQNFDERNLAHVQSGPIPA
jgi:glutamyl-Q tRNA(Asp) synthetase